MRKQIAIISEHASPLAAAGGVDSGGQNIYVANVARQLARLGNKVDVFTRRDSSDLPEKIEWEDGVRVILIAAGPPVYVKKERILPFMSDFASNMLDFISDNRMTYDVIHANFWMSGLVAAAVKSALRVPFAITFHALGKIRRAHQKDADEFPEVREEIERNVAAAADAVIGECPQDVCDLTRHYGVSDKKIVQIPCGFDPEEFEPVDKAFARVLLGFSPRDKIILQLGRMVPRKGVDTVIEAMKALVLEHGLSVKLVIVGGDLQGETPDALEIRRLKALAKRFGVSRNVMFRGREPRDQLKYYYSAADVFVTVPWYEPFGITPLESMACGTPVIGARVGGIKYSVQDGETGHLVPPKNPSALADTLRFAYQMPGHLQALGQRCIEWVNENFTWRRVSESIDALLSDIVLRAGRPEALLLPITSEEFLYEARTPRGLPYFSLNRRRADRSVS